MRTFADKIRDLDDGEMSSLSQQVGDENRARRLLMEGGI